MISTAPDPLPPITLVLGGASSGKSLFAERMINARGSGLYLATAEINDPEIAEKVRIHRGRRGENWITVEEPLELASVLEKSICSERIVLVECLSIWLSNLMAAGRDIGAETGTLIGTLSELSRPVVLVSNEVGLGGIPENKVARTFLNAAGQLNQMVALMADRVVLVTAGLPLVLKEVDQE